MSKKRSESKTGLQEHHPATSPEAQVRGRAPSLARTPPSLRATHYIHRTCRGPRDFRSGSHVDRPVLRISAHRAILSGTATTHLPPNCPAVPLSVNVTAGARPRTCGGAERGPQVRARPPPDRPPHHMLGARRARRRRMRGMNQAICIRGVEGLYLIILSERSSMPASKCLCVFIFVSV